jgi:hypothetical protein
MFRERLDERLIHDGRPYQFGISAEPLEAWHVCVIEPERYPTWQVVHSSQMQTGHADDIIGALLPDI